MVKKKSNSPRCIRIRAVAQSMQKRRGVRLLLPSMNFLGSSARSTNTRVFCQYLCKYSKNTDKSHSKRIFFVGRIFSSGFLRGCCWSKCMENNRLPALSFLVFSVIRLLELPNTLRNPIQYAGRLFPRK